MVMAMVTQLIHPNFKTVTVTVISGKIDLKSNMTAGNNFDSLGKGCLAALPWKSAFSVFFCFRPFPEGLKSSWEIQKTYSPLETV